MVRVRVSTYIESIGEAPVVVKQRRVGGWSSRSHGRPPSTEVLTAFEEPLLVAEGQTEREGRWLMAARHPGVVRLRRALPTEAALATDLSGLHNLATYRHPPATLARVLATVARTLAELHGRGLAHGSITGPHVILAGRELLDPVLCSPSTDAAMGLARPDEDVSALAALAEALMAPDAQPRPGRRAWAGWADVIEHLTGAEAPTTEAPTTAFTAAELFLSLARRPRRGWFRG